MMPSLRARLFLSLLRNRHLLQFKLRQDTAADWQNDLAGVRAAASKSSRMMGRLPKGMTARSFVVGTLPMEWINPERGDNEKTILYFQGGGYVLGANSAHRAIVAKFVRASGVRALQFQYRRAPEHPYPAALDDALTAYGWLLDQGVAPADIAFAGDSAGGGLCLATLLALKDKGVPLPACAAVLSPWTDLTCSGESLTTNARRCLAPKNSWYACRNHYAGTADPTQATLSPLFGDLAGLPPLHISAGGHETLLDDSTRFAHKARQAGVDVTLTIGPGLCHCYPACAPIFPEATKTLAQIGDFLAHHLSD